MTRDRMIGTVSLVLGVIVAIMTSQLPPSKMSGDIGPAVFPYISAGLLIICGAGLVITGKQHSEPFFSKDEILRLIKIFSAVLLYAVAMSYLGYLLPTFAIMFVLTRFFSENKNVALWKQLLYAAVITIAIWLLFKYVLSLKLPTSPLF